MNTQSNSSLCIHAISLIFGACIGIGVSFIVNCTLIEISKGKYFAYVRKIFFIKYFATFFLIIGIYILIKSLRNNQNTYQNPDYIQVNNRNDIRHKYLIFLGIMLIISCIFSVGLHTQIFIKLHYMIKMPIYSALGIAVTFALCVSIIDIINTAFHLIQSKDMKPVINSSKQIIPIIFLSCLMGLLFGTIFGLMDMEDVSFQYLKTMLMKEENYCLPIGIVCGGISGLITTLVDNNEPSIADKNFKPLSQEEEVEV